MTGLTSGAAKENGPRSARAVLKLWLADPVLDGVRMHAQVSLQRQSLVGAFYQLVQQAEQLLEFFLAQATELHIIDLALGRRQGGQQFMPLFGHVQGDAAAVSGVGFLGHQATADQLADHSTPGAALTMRGVQSRRPSLFDLVEDMKKITAPTLIMTGDEDWPCLEPSILMKRTIATAGLVVMPNTGHTINLEEPAAFNAQVADFLHAVEAGRWPTRDPRAMSAAILGK